MRIAHLSSENDANARNWSGGKDERTTGTFFASRAKGEMMAKTSGKRSRKRSSSKRDVIRGARSSAYAKRSSGGRFREMDDVGRSQKSDRRKKAKRIVKSGFGDQGDQQKPRRRRSARKAR
ncbi:MAG TPA: hypothetical protein VES67_07055 [Vicinamibacterales bacterium]|nr:hypothetical protein [Vicinamibacterales bacterium]